VPSVERAPRSYRIDSGLARVVSTDYRGHRTFTRRQAGNDPVGIGDPGVSSRVAPLIDGELVARSEDLELQGGS